MATHLIYPVGCTPAVDSAVRILGKKGYHVTDHPSPEVTHLLLDVPSFQKTGEMRSGQDIHSFLEVLPDNITVIGGNLQHPELCGYSCMDLLLDADFVAKNAGITAYCALQIAASRLPWTYSDLPVLVIGWGRIGKILCRLLRQLGARVIVLPHKNEDRAIVSALGYGTVSIDSVEDVLPGIRLIFNTAPTQVLSAGQSAMCIDCTKIDLASINGIPGDDVITARGLPGTYAPESTGCLIAETVDRLLKEVKK